MHGVSISGGLRVPQGPKQRHIQTHTYTSAIYFMVCFVFKVLALCHYAEIVPQVLFTVQPSQCNLHTHACQPYMTLLHVIVQHCAGLLERIVQALSTSSTDSPPPAESGSLPELAGKEDNQRLWNQGYDGVECFLCTPGVLEEVALGCFLLSMCSQPPAERWSLVLIPRCVYSRQARRLQLT